MIGAVMFAAVAGLFSLIAPFGGDFIGTFGKFSVEGGGAGCLFVGMVVAVEFVLGSAVVCGGGEPWDFW